LICTAGFLFAAAKERRSERFYQVKDFDLDKMIGLGGLAMYTSGQYETRKLQSKVRAPSQTHKKKKT